MHVRPVPDAGFSVSREAIDGAARVALGPDRLSGASYQRADRRPEGRTAYPLGTDGPIRAGHDEAPAGSGGFESRQDW
jgi:hypothetical protein